MLTDLQGQIERITYSNEENGYTIAKVKVYGRRDLVTVVGNFMAPMPGEILKMQGEWANHPKFGEQFKVVHYRNGNVGPGLYRSDHTRIFFILIKMIWGIFNSGL